MGAVGNVFVRVGADTRGLSRGLRSARSQMRTFNSQMVGIGKALTGLFAFHKITQGIKSATEAYKEFSSATLGLQSIVENQGKSFETSNKFIQSYIKDGLVPATDAITSYKNLLLRGYNTSEIEKVMNRLKDSAAFGRQGSLTLGEAIRGATEGLKNENSILVDNAGVTKNVSMMWADYAKTLGVGVKSLTQAQKRQAEVNGILEETRYMVGNAEKYTTTYAGKLAAFNKVLYDLRVAWGRAFARIAEVVLPALTNLGNALITVGNTFSQFIAAITGQQQDAGSSAKAAIKQEAKLGSAIGEAGKKAKGALAGFDEINELQENMASGGSGAVDGITDISEGINNIGDTNVSVENPFKKLAESIKKDFEPEINKLNKSFAKLRVAAEDLWNNEAFIEFRKWMGEKIKNTSIDMMKGSILMLSGAFETLAGAIEIVDGLLSGDFEKTWTGAENVVKGVWDTMKGFATFTGLTHVPGIEKAIDAVDSWGSEWEKFRDRVKKANDPTKLELEDFRDYFKNDFLGEMEWAFIGWGKDIKREVDVAWNGIEDVSGKRHGGFKKDWDKFWGDVGNDWRNFWLGVEITFIDILNSIIGAINKVSTEWNKLKFKTPKIDLPDWMGGGSWGGNTIGVKQLGMINKISYPGEISTVQSLNPNSTSSFIGQTAGQAISSAATGEYMGDILNALNKAQSQGNKDTVVQIDGKTLGRILMPYMANESNRVGNTAIITAN